MSGDGIGKKPVLPGILRISKNCPRHILTSAREKKMKKELEALSVSEEERGQMTELAVEMNRNYFAGMTKPEKEIADTPGWKLWKEKGAELFFGSYMDSMMEDAGHDENRLLLPPKSDAGNR